jgi:hypothetical protein
MAVSIIQKPSDFNFAQSPEVYVVSESNAQALTSSSYQYALDLYYWTGSLSNSGSTAKYTMLKYPNAARVGQFDISRIMSSVFTDLRQENSSSVYYRAVDVYEQYKTNPTGSFITGSHTKSVTQGSVDGYQRFQDSLQVHPLNLYGMDGGFAPILTDGPVTQSYFTGDTGRLGVWMLPVNAGAVYTPDIVTYYPDGKLVGAVNYNLTAWNGTTQRAIDTIPIGPAEPDFPLTGSFSSFQIGAFDYPTKLGGYITFVSECQKKYPPVRIAWKNRYGQFDYFNFNLVSRESFNTQRSRYQPQIGTWDSRTLNYNDYDSSIQNYITDSTLKLSVNTDYVSEDYNEIFKQLMVSDEIYWLYDQANNKVRPLAMDTSTFNIKTNVVDKLIQYSFDFTQGQGFKLIF